MDRNYCFRRKRHSYAACDAALAASLYYNSRILYVTQNGTSQLKNTERNNLRNKVVSERIDITASNKKINNNKRIRMF